MAEQKHDSLKCCSRIFFYVQKRLGGLLSSLFRGTYLVYRFAIFVCRGCVNIMSAIMGDIILRHCISANALLPGVFFTSWQAEREAILDIDPGSYFR